jgi:hypothetical protein
VWVDGWKRCGEGEWIDGKMGWDVRWDGRCGEVEWCERLGGLGGLGGGLLSSQQPAHPG